MPTQGSRTAATVAAVAFALFAAALLPAQTFAWQRVVDRYTPQQLPAEHLSRSERSSLTQLLIRRRVAGDECADEPTWTQRLALRRVRLGPGHYTLAEAGVGCLRSGQGANGAMWLLRWEGSRPVLLGDLYGWFHHVLPQRSHGLHDMTVGSHSSASEFGLQRFRFNGRTYRAVASADVRCDDERGCRAEALK